MPKLSGAIGVKHSGKTTVIEDLITELTRGGYHEGTIKEMVRIPTLTLLKQKPTVHAGRSRKIVAVLKTSWPMSRNLPT